jgi:hypothetical protein
MPTTIWDLAAGAKAKPASNAVVPKNALSPRINNLLKGFCDG